jgi:site-specific DNA-methyltransferase (adenine-specific)
MKKNKIYVGNNLDVLKTFPDNYFDSVVTDPPYGLGKEPDVVEVMKSWIEKGYHDIQGKGFMGKEWDKFVPQPILWKEVFRVLKPGGYLLSFAGTRTYDWVVIGLRFAGFEIRDMIGWLYSSGFPKSHNIGLSVDKMLGHSDRGHRIAVASRNHPDGTFEPNGEQLEPYEAKEEQAKQWQGWETALKPSIEPIVMARKPLQGTVAQNVLKWGVGGINIDESRVEFVNEEDKGNPLRFQTNNGSGSHGIFNQSKNVTSVVGEKGRFPANIIHDGSDEVKEIFPVEKEQSASRFFKECPFTEEDKRFYYVPKASQGERNDGLYGFEDKTVDDGRKKIADNAYQRGATLRRNIKAQHSPNR